GFVGRTRPQPAGFPADRLLGGLARPRSSRRPALAPRHRPSRRLRLRHRRPLRPLAASHNSAAPPRTSVLDSGACPILAPASTASFGSFSTPSASAPSPTPPTTATSAALRSVILPSLVRLRFRLWSPSAWPTSHPLRISLLPPARWALTARERRTLRARTPPRATGKWPAFGSTRPFPCTSTASRPKSFGPLNRASVAKP